MDKTVVDYISRNLKKGVPLAKIKTTLSKAGHPVGEIEAASKQVLSEEPHLTGRPAMIKYVYIVAGIGAIVIIAYLALTLIPSISLPAPEPEPVIVSEPELPPKSREDNIALLKLAKVEDDTDVCSEITDHYLYYVCSDKYWERDDCSYEGAIEEGLEECAYETALSTKNSTFCLLSADKEDCLFQLASQEKDLAYCDGNTVCAYRFAVEFTDPDGCDLLNIEDNKGDCFDIIARDSGDKSLCEKGTDRCMYWLLGSDEEKRQYALSAIDDAPEGQSAIAGPLSKKEQVLAAFILDVEDPMLCDLYPSGSYKGYSYRTICLWVLAKNRDMEDACDMLDGTEKVLCSKLITEGCTPETEAACAAMTR